MIAHLLYARYVVRHKWFVFLAGVRLGAPSGWPLLRHLRWWLQLALHDLSKLRSSEWTPYVDYFYGPPVGGCAKCKEARQEAFDRAWLHHQHRNLHHWQRWLLRLDKPAGRWRVLAGDDPRGRDWHLYEGDGAGEKRGILLGQTDAIGATAQAIAGALNSHPRALPMPERYVREMLADWMGAGRAITGRWETPKWYMDNRHNMVLHPDTRAYVERELGITYVPGGRALVPVYDIP